MTATTSRTMISVMLVVSPVAGTDVAVVFVSVSNVTGYRSIAWASVPPVRHIASAMRMLANRPITALERLEGAFFVMSRLIQFPSISPVVRKADDAEQ